MVPLGSTKIRVEQSKMSDVSLRGFTELLEMAPGTDLGSSDWYRVTQDDINTFATLTKDEDPYHINPEWAKDNSPLGTTISFGFLTLSMLTYFSYQVFERAGFVTILLARAVPILPEVSACLAGMTGMRFGRFLLAWTASTLPFAAIGAFGGSASTLADPRPGIFTALAISGTLWLSWAIWARHSAAGTSDCAARGYR